MEDVRPGGEAKAPAPDVVSRAGGALRQAAERLRSSGVLEREELHKLRFVPEELDNVGEYLERRRFPGLRLDAERLIVARPLVALAIAAMAGYAAARAVKK